MRQPKSADRYQLRVSPVNVAIKGRPLAMAGQCLGHRVGQASIAEFGQAAMAEGSKCDVLRQVGGIRNLPSSL